MLALRRTITAILVASAAVALGACGRDEGGGGTDPGFTDDTVKIGGICPSSGPIAEFATACAVRDGLFRHLNDRFGGIKMGDGKTRKIEFTWYDDGYDPSRTIQQAKRLVEQDQVALVMGANGTATNLAIRDYLNERGVPHLATASGSTLWGFEAGEYPWTMGFQTAYSAEASVYAGFLAQERPGAKVALLYQNDDFGKDLRGAFKRAAGGTDVEVVAEESYDATASSVDSQVASLQSSGADVLMLFAVPKFATLAMRKAHSLGWDAMIVTNAIANSVKGVMEPAGPGADGVYAGAYVQDPTSAAAKTDEDVEFVRQLKQRYKLSQLNPDDSLSILGLAQGAEVVWILEHAKAPTREAVIEAARAAEPHRVRGLLPGIELATGPEDPFPMESLQMQRFDGDQWVDVGEPITRFEGKTPPPGTG
jgi:branched-chain amino acid transport system substrate-binding protein